MDYLPTRRSHAFLPEEHHRREHQNRRVDEEGDAQCHDGINRIEADRTPNGRLILL